MSHTPGPNVQENLPDVMIQHILALWLFCLRVSQVLGYLEIPENVLILLPPEYCFQNTLNCQARAGWLSSACTVGSASPGSVSLYLFWLG